MQVKDQTMDSHITSHSLSLHSQPSYCGPLGVGLWLPVWWAWRLPWWPPAECSNVSMLCAFLVFTKCFFLSLYHCCLLSEIKLNTTATLYVLNGKKWWCYRGCNCAVDQLLWAVMFVQESSLSMNIQPDHASGLNFVWSCHWYMKC